MLVHSRIVPRPPYHLAAALIFQPPGSVVSLIRYSALPGRTACPHDLKPVHGDIASHPVAGFPGKSEFQRQQTCLRLMWNESDSAVMLRLMLLRHAKSSWPSPGMQDAARPLNGCGEAAARLM